MKHTLTVLAITAIGQAHYSFRSTTYEGKDSAPWEFIRKIDPDGTDFPEFDVYGSNFTCNRLAANPFTTLGTKTLNVTAGSTIAFNTYTSIIHPGPLQFYLTKVPPSSSVQDFDGKGSVWFKIASDLPSIIDNRLTWPNFGKSQVSVSIPPCVADGEYLLRLEHIALHNANRVNQTQYYMSCAQIRISGGTGTAALPPPQQNMLAFPGSYDPEDPGIHLGIWYPIPTNYTAPGGPVMSC